MLNLFARYRALSFERLREQDFDLLYYWLNQSHIRAFYPPEAIELMVISQKCKSKLPSNFSIHCFLIYKERSTISSSQTDNYKFK